MYWKIVCVLCVLVNENIDIFIRGVLKSADLQPFVQLGMMSKRKGTHHNYMICGILHKQQHLR